MAPPPEYDKEPKAPDKSVTTVSNDDSKAIYNNIKEPPTNSEHRNVTAGANAEGENKHVEALDDGQLRALLDEAITYKCPKDREGKSNLFKELLEEVEQDEQASEAAARGLGAARGARRGRARREHHSSLQDLVAAMAGEAAPRRARAPAAPPASVSARALHGGSLPSGVDTSFMLGEEAARGGYLATVRCVNPPPLAERRVSAGDAGAPPAADDAPRRSKPSFPMTYTARATLEIGSGSVCSGRAVTTTTASNQVDAAIPFSCISSPEVVAGCSTTASAPPPAPAADPKPRSVVSSTFNGLPLSRPGCGAAEEYKKSLDENGNAVQGFGSPLSGSGQQKKPRRKKSSKNETVIKSHQIDGYQGNKDLNEVLRFIESNAEGARAPHKLGRVKHRDDADDKGKKRSSERRKDRDGEPERASSLDERARPSRAERAARAAPPPAPPERRSWGDGAPPAEPPEPELADFQTVTKRRKPRRHEREPEPPRRARPPSPARAPPSDRSNDSNDDMDSVTSLPAAPPPPPPHASYADIARTRHNIPDLIESCNFYAEGEAEAVARPAAPRARKERAEPAAAPAPDVVGERRPAVVLRPGARAPDLDGVTFGFDVNEQLLGARVDLLRGPRCAPLRYEPPAAPPDAAQLLRVVAYVAAAWDDVVRCGGGAVRYFSE